MFFAHNCSHTQYDTKFISNLWGANLNGAIYKYHRCAQFYKPTCCTFTFIFIKTFFILLTLQGDIYF